MENANLLWEGGPENSKRIVCRTCRCRKRPLIDCRIRLFSATRADDLPTLTFSRLYGGCMVALKISPPPFRTICAEGRRWMGEV
jgi:hypothetical protein